MMMDKRKLKTLLQRVESLEEFAREAEQKHKHLLDPLTIERKISACNLLHYLGIRRHDLRPIQKDLASLAISSQSHAEAYTLNNLQKIKRLIKSLLQLNHSPEIIDALDHDKSAEIIGHNASELLGTPSHFGQTKIMVTLPTEAATDYAFVKRLVRNGMNIARINTAYDDQDTWSKMIDHCKRAGAELGFSVKIYMDLIGPRIRIGELATTSIVYTKKDKPAIHLHKGDKLKIFRQRTEEPLLNEPAVTLSLQELFDVIDKNEKIWFDEGKMGGVIRSKDLNQIVVEITNAPEKGFKLKEGKGINLPDSIFELPALTEIDLTNLPFIAAHADMLGFSFVRTVGDIIQLQQALKKLGKEDIGIILKIETRVSFDNLPSLLFQVMQSKKAGVMIARGDLAVELGMVRMAEVQEEILWLAEAAHLPVVWATQILDTQVKKGTPTRAEISDVVKATRSECIMLNKGMYVVDALKILKDMDIRMYRHEVKEHKMLRALHVAQNFLDAP